MKSVARTVCGIELSEDIINLIFAIFDDDDSKAGFYTNYCDTVADAIISTIFTECVVKTNIRRWADVNLLTLWKLVSSVV